MAVSKKKEFSTSEILEKIRHFCAYQERSYLQVARKLRTIGTPESEMEAIITYLKEEDYLNEKRFVAQYIRSRASQKGWGPGKIIQGLRRETGEDHSAAVRSDSMADQKSIEKLKKELEKKYKTLLQKKDPMMLQKLCNFCLSRGFDFDTAHWMVRKIQSGEGN